ncbi:MAG: hypothetical protein KDC05_02840 [Bacteroidales bacterium]|nr:hypothetical protein [Bacteroidales bacterium]
MTNFIKLTSLLILILLLSACYPEWKLAKSYIDSKPEISIMVLPVNYVFKENLKSNEVKLNKDISDSEKDSVLLANSLFLKDVSDSVFLETFINNMITEFQELGFTVTTHTSLDSFLFIQSPAYILNIGQILLEEHYVQHEDEEEYGDLTYYKNLDLNAVTFNFWFELSHLNEENEKTHLFFADETIHDVVDGYFSQNLITGDVKYKYHISELDTAIIYRYSGVYGTRYAGYIFDYLMNRYIREHWSSSGRQPYYMRYNRSNNTLDPASEEVFIEMDE